MEKEAYPGGTLSDATMIELFLRGLRDVEVIRYVCRCHPTTFDEAVEIAARDEADAGPTSVERTRKPRPDMIAKIDQIVTPQIQNDITKPGSSGPEEQKKRGPRKDVKNQDILSKIALIPEAILHHSAQLLPTPLTL